MEKKRILIIDDDISSSRLLKLGLERTGAYDVHDENLGLRGLAAARQFQPHLILLDIVMPDSDGGDVAATILADRNLRHIPIVFMTSLVSEQEESAADLTSHGFRFLAKPATTEKVIGCIEEQLAR